MHVPLHRENMICRLGHLCCITMLHLWCNFVIRFILKFAVLAIGYIAVLIACSALVGQCQKKTVKPTVSTTLNDFYSNNKGPNQE